MDSKKTDENQMAMAPNERSVKSLKKLIEEELTELDKWDNYENAFQPLTDGLGLDSPRKKGAVSAEENPPPKPDLTKQLQVQRIQEKVAALREQVDKAPEPKQSPIEKQEDKTQESLPVLPPPRPAPGLSKRMMAGILDQFFVLTLWLLATVITLRVLTGSFVVGTDQLALLEEKRFLSFAVFEFGAIWIAYLVFCIGVLDMTFGMWVWGIRVGYMTKSKPAWMWKKFLRTFLSFIFYAPVLPVIFLCFIGKRGRNLLDALSGTVVYQSVVTER